MICIRAKFSPVEMRRFSTSNLDLTFSLQPGGVPSHVKGGTAKGLFGCVCLSVFLSSSVKYVLSMVRRPWAGLACILCVHPLGGGGGGAYLNTFFPL